MTMATQKHRAPVGGSGHSVDPDDRKPRLHIASGASFPVQRPRGNGRDMTMLFVRRVRALIALVLIVGGVLFARVTDPVTRSAEPAP